jgi:hypothetical protein
MTAQEREVLGALAGWRKCIRCHGLVEPWHYGTGRAVCHTEHAICYLVRQWRTNVQFVFDSNPLMDSVLAVILEETQ